MTQSEIKLYEIMLEQRIGILHIDASQSLQDYIEK